MAFDAGVLVSFTVVELLTIAGIELDMVMPQLGAHVAA